MTKRIRHAETRAGLPAATLLAVFGLVFACGPRYALGGGSVIFQPRLDQVGRASNLFEFDLTSDDPEALARQAEQASVRVGYGTAPLVFRTDCPRPAILALHIARASRGGAKLVVTVEDRTYGLIWPPADNTHIVDATYFLVLPPGPAATTVAVPSGVVVLDRYTLYPSDQQVSGEVMTPMPSGEDNQWTDPSEPWEGAKPGALRRRVAGVDPAAGALGWPYTLSPHDSGMVLEDCWPTIYFGVERVPEMRRKINSLPWARAAFDQLKREAEQVLATEPVQPIEPVGWRHDFYSRRSGEHLVYDPSSPDRFLDPWTGGFEELPAQHRAWVLLTHERTHRLMRSLGFLYALTNDERYAAWVAEGLRRAVEMFRHAELRNKAATDALYFQPLYDAPALIMLCDSYVLTRDSQAYSAEDHERIRTGIFEEGMPYQIRFLDGSGVHNMSCFVAAALATAGQHFGRQDWVDRALRDEGNSLGPLLKRGVPGEGDEEPDGFWFEGTMFYHYYSLCPLITMYEIDRRLGGEASKDPDVRRRLEAMLAAPASIADPSLRLPTVGDLGAPGVMSLPLYRHVYEYAAGQVDPDHFGPLLAALYATGVPRNSLTALAFGPDDLPEPRLPSGSALLERRGIGVLRGTDGWYLLFKAGPHGAGHDHPDKLEITLNARGRLLAPDLGTAGYALDDIHSYYRSTLSHNTLFVDEADQQPVHDASLAWRPDVAPGYAHGTVRDAYEGVILERRVWFDPPYVVVADTCSSAEQHRYGWAFHAYGSLHGEVSRDLEDLGLPPIGPLRRYLTGGRTACTDGLLDATWRVEQGLYLRLLATSDGAFEAMLGRTPGNPMPDDQGVVVLRAPGQQRRFSAVFEVHSASPSVSSLAPKGEGLVVLLADGSRRVYDPAD